MAWIQKLRAHINLEYESLQCTPFIHTLSKAVYTGYFPLNSRILKAFSGLFFFFWQGQGDVSLGGLRANPGSLLFLRHGLGLSQSCVSVPLRFQKRERVLEGSQGSHRSIQAQNHCLIASYSSDSHFLVDELVGGGDRAHPHFRRPSFSLAVFL